MPVRHDRSVPGVRAWMDGEDEMSDRATITPELVLAVCEDVSNGKTLTQAAKERGTSGAAIRYHLMKDAELFSHSARAREIGCDAIADECIEIADDPEIDPTDKRIRIDTRIRLIGKWSQRYSDKLTVKNETTVTHRYDLDSLDASDLDTLEAIARKASIASGDTGGSIAPEPAALH